MECGAKEESEKKSEGGKEGEGERVRDAREISFQKVIPPTLSTSNPNVVSGVKSCQSSNGRQTALFTNLKKRYACIHLLYLFSANE